MLIITGIFMCFSSPIQFISPSNQAVCIHEAGHIVMALTLGYDVVGAALFYGPPPYGLSSISRTRCDNDGKGIAAAALAAEILLYRRGLLVDNKGIKITEKQFIDQAVGKNAQHDKVKYFGKDLSFGGYWPKYADNIYIQHASNLTGVISSLMIKAVSDALLTEHYLPFNRIQGLWAGAGASPLLLK